MKHLILLAIACLLCASCTKPTLHVRSEYYGRRDLASCALGTPDPKKASAGFGQRLIINWGVPYETFRTTACIIKLQVRLNNGEEKTTMIPLTKARGMTFYPIFGADYTEKGGLQSYYAELESSGKTIAKSRHKLWVARIKHNQ
jgi:hypothetical protein